MEQQINFSNIVDSKRFQEDRSSINTSGNKRFFQIIIIFFMLFIPLLWPVLIFYAYYYHKKNKTISEEQMKLLGVFAEVNGFEFTQHHKGVISSAKKSIAVDLPYKYEQSIPWYELRGSIGSYTFLYAMVSTIIGNNKNKDMSAGTYNIFTINLPVSFPKMLVDSKVNNLGVIDAKATDFIQSEDHNLEGDFYQFYNVRIEKNEQIDMYTSLTPEVMDTLKQNNYYDIWLSGNKLTLITFGDQKRYFAGLPTAFETAITLMKEIDKIARVLRQKSTNSHQVQPNSTQTNTVNSNFEPNLTG